MTRTAIDEAVALCRARRQEAAVPLLRRVERDMRRDRRRAAGPPLEVVLQRQLRRVRDAGPGVIRRFTAVAVAFAVASVATACAGGPTAPTPPPPAPEPEVITRIVKVTEYLPPPTPPIVSVTYRGGGRFQTAITRQGEVNRDVSASIDGRAVPHCNDHRDGRRCVRDLGGVVIVRPTSSMIEHQSLVQVTLVACYRDHPGLCGEGSATYTAGLE